MTPIAPEDQAKLAKDITKLQMDRIIIRVMRIAVFGLLGLSFFFVCYIIVLFATSAHDNERIDRLEERVRQLEQRPHAP